jgi:hypothetical protein
VTLNRYLEILDLCEFFEMKVHNVVALAENKNAAER